MQALAVAIDGMALPAVEKISSEHAEDPLRILVGTMLSARTQDATTHAASSRLFRVAPTAQAMSKLTTRAIEKLIFPVGFYRNKATFVKGIADAIVNRFDGRVPDTLDELVTLPGVGRKTANLVMILAFRSRASASHARASHRESPGLGADAGTGGDGTGALQGHRTAVVAVHQPAAGDMGPERLPPDRATVRRLRSIARLSTNRRRRREAPACDSMIRPTLSLPGSEW
jgi:hypothetical protein